MIARDTIYAAVFAKAVTVTPPQGGAWAQTGRWLKIWDDVPNQPAMFMQQMPQTGQRMTAGLTKWTLKANLWVYFRSDGGQDEANYPDKAINDFIDAMDAALHGPIPGEQQTLDGTVEDCFIDGTVFSDGGITDNQGVIVIPISILTANP